MAFVRHLPDYPSNTPKCSIDRRTYRSIGTTDDGQKMWHSVIGSRAAVGTGQYSRNAEIFAGHLELALPAIEPLGRRAIASVDGVCSSRFCCDGVDSSHIRALTCGISLALLLQSGEAGAIVKRLRDSHAHLFSDLRGTAVLSLNVISPSV